MILVRLLRLLPCYFSVVVSVVVVDSAVVASVVVVVSAIVASVVVVDSAVVASVVVVDSAVVASVVVVVSAVVASVVVVVSAVVASVVVVVSAVVVDSAVVASVVIVVTVVVVASVVGPSPHKFLRLLHLPREPLAELPSHRFHVSFGQVGRVHLHANIGKKKMDIALFERIIDRRLERIILERSCRSDRIRERSRR
jgi:hypothetical protein